MKEKETVLKQKFPFELHILLQQTDGKVYNCSTVQQKSKRNKKYAVRLQQTAIENYKFISLNGIIYFAVYKAQ